MNCSDFESALDKRLDGRGGPWSDEATAHRQSCPACARIWQDHCLLDAAVKHWRPVETPAGLLELVLHRLSEVGPVSRPSELESDHSPRRPTRSGRWVVAAVAACLALVCVFAARSPDEGRGGPLVKSVTKPLARGLVAGSSPTEVSESVVALIDDLKAEYRGLAEETTATAHDFVAVLPQPVVWAQAAPLEPDVDGVAAPPVAEIGRTIGDQIGQAIGFLWQSVPSDDSAG